jgi:hypothetical protein
MKYALFLLAVIVGTVFGIDELGAKIVGYKADGKFCSDADMDFLYEECVVDKALIRGAKLGPRRLELRGSNRDRQLSCSKCPDNPPRGTWCFVKCSRRRLTFTDEHPEKALVTKGLIEKDANICYDKKAEDPRYACLGDKNQIRIRIFYDDIP